MAQVMTPGTPPAGPRKGGSAPAGSPAPAAAKTRPARAGKPTQWRRWAEQVTRFFSLTNRLGAMSRGAVGKPDKASKALVELLRTASFDAEGAELVKVLHGLDADQVPVPRVAPAPKFAVGDKVKIVKKLALPRYTAFVELYALERMTVTAVSDDGHQFLCDVDGVSVQIQVATPKHLEKR